MPVKRLAQLSEYTAEQNGQQIDKTMDNNGQQWTRKQWTRHPIKTTMDKTPNQNISIQGNALITFVLTN
jgi:hypothetical protein